MMSSPRADKGRPKRYKKRMARKEERSPFCFEGPQSSEIIQSVITCMLDLLNEANILLTPYERQKLTEPISKFVRLWFDQLLIRHNSIEVQQFADLCKERRNDLLEFSNMLLAKSISAVNQTLNIFAVTYSKEDEADLFDVTLIDYLPSHVKRFLLIEDSFITNQVILAAKPRIYVHLYHYVMEMYHILERYPDVNQDIKTLLITLGASVGQIYEKLNSCDESRTQFEDKTLQILTKESTELSQEFMDLFNSVVKDLDLDNQFNKHERYTYAFRRAYNKVKDNLLLPFNNKDYYAALKGTASHLEGQKKGALSLIASLYELDSIKLEPAVKDFDNLIGYQSGYREEPIEGYSSYRIKTILIDNPSKYKPRAIHISENAIQDRCSWIHNRLKLFLRSLDTDCMKQHLNGVSFLQTITAGEYRNKHNNSIYCYDFSNATDTLSQEFQELVLGLLFPKEVVEFWHFISKMDKVLIRSNGDEVPYHQSSGQPQGLLGSFDAFSLAHHIIMMMVMKKCHLENQDAVDCYRVLGDDSILSSIHQESQQGITGQSYEQICKEANLEINLSKSTLIYPESDSAMADFAKVTVRNGRTFTPIPSGLIFTYGKEKTLNNIATVLWINREYHLPLRKMMDAILIREFPNPKNRVVIQSIIYSGDIEFLEDFKDPDFISPPSLKGAAIYCYGISLFKDSIIGFMLSNKVREQRAESQINYNEVSWEGMIPSKKIESWLEGVPNNHKYWKLLEDSDHIASDMMDLLNVSQDQSVILGEVLFGKEINNDFSLIRSISETMESFRQDKTNPIPEVLAGLEFKYMFQSIKEMEPLLLRSVTKREGSRAKFFKKGLKEFNSYFRESEDMEDMIKYTLDHNKDKAS